MTKHDWISLALFLCILFAIVTPISRIREWMRRSR